MKNLPLLLITLGGTLALILGVTFLFGRSTTPVEFDSALLTANARHIYTLETETATDSADLGDEPADATSESEATGEAEPKTDLITVVEFSDFQCPACRAAAPIKDEIFANFPGQVRFIYRHFPLLSIHPNALLAAQAADAAGEFDQFWPYHDLLFNNQDEWADLSQDDARNKFIEYAEGLEIDEDLFTEAINSDKVKTNVQSDISLANELKLNSTPTFFVDGQKVSASEIIPTIAEQLQN